MKCQPPSVELRSESIEVILYLETGGMKEKIDK